MCAVRRFVELLTPWDTPAMMAAIAVVVLSDAVAFADLRNRDEPVFERDVLPILAQRCLSCHGRGIRKAGLDLRSVAFMQIRDTGRPVVVAGSAESSLLFQRVAEGSMPPDEELTEEQIAIIKSWIDAGAPADDPSLVYGAGFFRQWGTCVVSLTVFIGLVAVVVYYARRCAGSLVVAGGVLPVLLTASSTAFWYPPDELSLASVGISSLTICGGGIIWLRSAFRRD